MTLNTSILRKMWRFVETCDPYSIVKLSDEEIVQNLIQQVEDISALNSEDIEMLSKYIKVRTPLIRDLIWLNQSWLWASKMVQIQIDQLFVL